MCLGTLRTLASSSSRRPPYQAVIGLRDRGAWTCGQVVILWRFLDEDPISEYADCWETAYFVSASFIDR
jgi:hypothetical protein